MKTSNKVLMIVMVAIVLGCGFAYMGRGVSDAAIGLFHSNIMFAVSKDSATNKSYNITSFDSLKIDTSGDIKIVTGETPRVEVTGSPDFLSHLNVFANRSTLHLELDKRWRGRNWDDVKIIIVTNSPLQNLMLAGSNRLEAENLKTENLNVQIGGFNYCNFSGEIDHLSLELAGSGHVNVEKLIAKDVTVSAAGSSDINFAGKTSRFDILAAGSTHLDAEKLIAEDVSIQSAGSSHIIVYANHSLTVKGFGSSKIKYFGHPKNITSDVMGSTNVYNGND